MCFGKKIKLKRDSKNTELTVVILSLFRNLQKHNKGLTSQSENTYSKIKTNKKRTSISMAIAIYSR